ncbi:MAG: exosortase/archaeosortase family protein [Candidatus Hydrogenedentes bacterium]|nr:exosortase/archaeosortase family protein [Candidatus Hydrogenedentota bacterium]
MSGTLSETMGVDGATRAEGRDVFSSNMLVVGVAVLGCWGAWWRMGGQWFEPGFNASGLATMGVAIGFACYRAWATRREAVPIAWPWLFACAGLLTAYGLLYGGTPKLVTSLIAVMLVSAILLGALPREERQRAWGLAPWMLASLPLGVAVNLYFGYPLRVAVGWIASAVMMGQVTPLGTGLSDGTHTVFVDAPCSGIQMLRVAVLLAGILAVLFRLRLAGTVILCLNAVLLALVGNTLRVCVLFLLTRRGDVSDALHTWSGLVIFAGCALALVGAGVAIARWQIPEVRSKGSIRAQYRPVATVSGAAFYLAALLAFAVPFAVAERPHEGGNSVPWPTMLMGERFVASPPDPALAKYRDIFLGTMVQGVLEASGRLVLLRQCVEPTLSLHTSENCYVVAGFQCAALPAERDAQGHLWSRFSAVHPDGRSYVVRQCFFSVDSGSVKASNRLEDWTTGRPSWPDSSSWYWAAARPGSEVGHTLAVTIAEDS